MKNAAIPVVEPTESSSLRFRFDDTGKVLEVSELLFRQARLLSDSYDVIRVERFDHSSKSLQGTATDKNH